MWRFSYESNGTLRISTVNLQKFFTFPQLWRLSFEQKWDLEGFLNRTPKNYPNIIP